MPPQNGFALPTCGRTEKERLQLAQTALNRYDALLSRWQHEPQAAEDIILARIDRLGALYAHGDYPQVIREYQALTEAQHSVPGWAIGWAISAYLQEKNATAAFSLLQRYPQYAADPQDEEHALSTPAGHGAVSGRSPVCRAPDPQRSVDPLRFRLAHSAAQRSVAYRAVAQI